MPEKRKRRWGDRKDGYRLRDIDTMHVIMPYILPKRSDNEAVLNEYVDFENALSFLAEKNATLAEGEFKYTIFHLIIAALAKTIYFRPCMNYFIQGHRMYERNEISFSFVIKKQFEDGSHEALAKFVVDRESNLSILDQVNFEVKRQVFATRQAKKTDKTTKKMNAFKRCPRFLLKFAVRVVKWMDYHGWLPRSFTKDDPYFSTVFLSNLGSIQMNANYHHLAEYGTNSFFAIVGKMKKRPRYNDDQSVEMRNTVDIAFTIDERIADGVYFAKSVKLFKHLIANPKLLDEPVYAQFDCDLSLSSKNKT